MLLDHLLLIRNQSHSRIPQADPPSRIPRKTVHYQIKVREARRIDYENSKLSERLDKTRSEYTARKMHKDY